MDYYLNEYSLRGQFASVEDFFESLRNYTFPILNKIKDDEYVVALCIDGKHYSTQEWGDRIHFGNQKSVKGYA